jgi:exonuclease III
VNLSIASQNCNSLNITSSLENWELKVNAILSLQTDIILLSDLRLKRKDGLDITNKLKAAILKFTGRKYDLWENSTKKGRGVGILIARDLGATILDGCEDQDQNIILLSIRIGTKVYIIGSVYGPNGACPFFYKNLNIFIKSMQSKFLEPVPVFLGGDWNTVLDDNDPELNIDIYENKSVPNAANNKKLLELMNMHHLVDLFRVIYPDTIDFTYAPFGVLRKTRSRLDFLFYPQR